MEDLPERAGSPLRGGMKKTVKSMDARAEAAGPITDSARHTARFAEAMKLFNAGDYTRARAAFEQAQQGPLIGVNESALMYLRMCDQRLERARLEAASAEEQYQLGLGLLKEERYSEALHHLESALQSADTAPLRYALALAAGLMGDPAAAARHLQKACEHDGSVRNRARNDPRFRNLTQFPEIRDALKE